MTIQLLWLHVALTCYTRREENSSGGDAQAARAPARPRPCLVAALRGRGTRAGGSCPERPSASSLKWVGTDFSYSNNSLVMDKLKVLNFFFIRILEQRFFF